MSNNNQLEKAGASQNRAYDGLMVVSEHEKSEWSRLARAAYAADRNDLGHRFSTAASMVRGASLPIAQFDALQSVYRAWLVSGFSMEGGAK